RSSHGNSTISEIKVQLEKMHGARRRGSAGDRAPGNASGSCGSRPVGAGQQGVSKDGERKADGVFAGLLGNGIADVSRKCTTQQHSAPRIFCTVFIDPPLCRVRGGS